MNIQEVLRHGHVTFMGIDLLVAPGALVPRSETELLGQTAIVALEAANSRAPRVIDVCCGAGNLACAIATKLPEARVWATDLTDGCAALARRNVEQLRLGARVIVCQGDLFAALESLVVRESVDVIVCNPPYISEHRLATDGAELLASEPREAFDAGPYGLRLHQRVVKEALPFLRPGGSLLFEFGTGQEKQVVSLFARTRAYGQVKLTCDVDGVPRVAEGMKLIVAR
jgi:release factor glutamine methyltransferase